MHAKGQKREKVNVITLGCAKNLVDSENLITQLKSNEFSVEHDQNGSESEVVIVNTCGFIDRAKEESIDTILNYARAKEEGRIEKLFVTGCLSERYREDLSKEIPEVDAWFGTMELPGLLAKMNADYRHELIGERWISTPAHFAYVKISEGCNRTCSFCAIPLMRGGHKSRPIEFIESEVKHLARNGVKEIILIAQELTYYGLDIYKKRSLPRLLDRLAEIEGIEWIRLHYAYPSKFPMEIIDVMKSHPSICNYLDMPLQHASDSVLHRMKRQISSKQTRDLISAIREQLPEIALRTTFLVGFPGETEEDFDLLKDFVKEQAFDRVGVFQYSHEENTSAYEFADDVASEVKAERSNALMEIQQDISYSKNREKVGKTFKVLFDRKEGGFFVGRTESDSPEVDNEVLVDASKHFVRVGDFANILIEDAMEYDLHGIPV